MCNFIDDETVPKMQKESEVIKFFVIPRTSRKNQLLGTKRFLKAKRLLFLHHLLFWSCPGTEAALLTRLKPFMLVVRYLMVKPNHESV